MAVSGSKISDFQCSFSRDSAEDFQHCCDPCLTEDQHVEAHGYCLDCREYLCNNCFRYHKKTKASRHHQLLDKDDMDKHSTLPKPVDVCIEKCSIHRNEVIKFFCPKHEEIGCTDCMTLNHKPCDIDYIPDKCADIGDSEEYMEIMKKLDQKMKEAEAALKIAAAKDNEIDDSSDRIIKEILKKRKEINDHLDTIQKKIEADASKEKATNKQKVKAVITSCTNFTYSIKKLQSSLQSNKAANQNGQLFIDIKRANSKLQSGEIQQVEMSLGKTRTQFTFNSNKDLDNILAVQSFGELTELKIAVDAPSKPLKTHAATLRTKGTFNSLQLKTDIYLNKSCDITGCVALSSDKLVLADNRNSALMVVNPEKKFVIEGKQLDSNPWDIAVLPQDQIAVTMPFKEHILVMRTAGQLAFDRSIPVTGDCRGIIYHQNCLYVLRWHPDRIEVLDMEGNIKNTISMVDQAIFYYPRYIVLSQDRSKLYVSDHGNDTIVSVTLLGEVSAKYKHQDLVRPRRMLILDDGSLLICCENNTIHHVSADMKQGRTVMDGFCDPWSICFSADRGEVYIGGKDDKVRVCSVYNV